jgi:hypothetical protein
MAYITGGIISKQNLGVLEKRRAPHRTIMVFSKTRGVNLRARLQAPNFSLVNELQKNGTAPHISGHTFSLSLLAASANLLSALRRA